MSQTRYYGAQLLNVLSYLRQQNIMHRDIKPANILLNEEGQIILADFGTAKGNASGAKSSNSASGTSECSYISGMSNISSVSGISKSNLSSNLIPGYEQLPESFEEIVGSEFYISPEMVTRREYSYASDYWALGVIIYQCLTGKVPFKGKTQDDTFDLIKRGVFDMPQDMPQHA